MKKIVIIIIVFIFSCKHDGYHDSFCIKEIEYINQSQKLIASIVKIQIIDSSGVLEQKMTLGKLKNVFLFSVKKSDRKFFHLIPFGTGKQFKIENNIIILPLITTLYEKDFGNKLSDQEIKEKIDGNVGFVFDKDTIIIKKCDNFPPMARI